MKFMAQFQIQPGKKNQVLEAFEKRGPSRTAGVKFVDAWIGIKADVAFVLLEAADEARVVEESLPWKSFGDVQIVPVNDIEQY